MKILLCSVFVILYAACVDSHGIRVKRGLSDEQRKKFVDTLNADRQSFGRKIETKFEILKYDMELEKSLEKCPLAEIKGTSFGGLKPGRDLRELAMKYSMPTAVGFFNPEQTKIGCNPELYCSQTITKDDQMPPELVGKVLESFGGCLLAPNVRSDIRSPEFRERLKELPHIDKYGDLLGVVGSSGRVFSLTLFLAILVYYF